VREDFIAFGRRKGLKGTEFYEVFFLVGLQNAQNELIIWMQFLSVRPVGTGFLSCQ
jgi:hypothetical protein